MRESEYWDSVNIQDSRRTIFEPAGTMLNNLYTAALFEGLGYQLGVDASVDNGQTYFKTQEIKKRFIEASQLFFGSKPFGKSDFKGTLISEATNMEIVTGNLILTFKNDSPVIRQAVYATNKVVPVQFFASAEAVEEFDLCEGALQKKDMLFIVVDTCGFVLSMSYEEYGVFLALFDDILKKIMGMPYPMAAQAIMKPSVQEKICYDFGAFYKYMVEKNILQQTVYRF